MDDSRNFLPMPGEDTGSYDADNEMPSQESETDSASPNYLSSVDEETPKDSEMDSESTNSEESMCAHLDKTDDIISSSPRETTPNGDLLLAQNENEGSPEVDQISYDSFDKSASNFESPDFEYNYESSDGMSKYAVIKPIKTVICDVCQKTFTDEDGLRVHKRIQSPNTRYHCNICEIYFDSDCELVCHISSKHPQDMSSP